MLTPEGIQGLLDMMGRQHTQIVVLSNENAKLRATLEQREQADAAKAKSSPRKPSARRARGT